MSDTANAPSTSKEGAKPQESKAKGKPQSITVGDDLFAPEVEADDERFVTKAEAQAIAEKCGGLGGSVVQVFVQASQVADASDVVRGDKKIYVLRFANGAETPVWTMKKFLARGGDLAGTLQAGRPVGLVSKLPSGTAGAMDLTRTLAAASKLAGKSAASPVDVWVVDENVSDVEFAQLASARATDDPLPTALSTRQGVNEREAKNIVIGFSDPAGGMRYANAQKVERLLAQHGVDAAQAFIDTRPKVGG